MNAKALVASAGVAALGGLGWAMLLVKGGRELDIAAIAIGAVIGLVATRLGARGGGAMIGCALLACSPLRAARSPP